VKDVGLDPDQIQINGSGNKNATVQFKQDLSQAKDNNFGLSKCFFRL
jgi:SecD/SecF fusion protein